MARCAYAIAPSGSAFTISSWVGRQAELGNIKTFEFHLLGHAHRAHGVYQREEDVREAEGIDRHQRRTTNLSKELMVIAVEQVGYTLSGIAEIIMSFS
jgi:hypothetical protein